MDTKPPSTTSKTIAGWIAVFATPAAVVLSAIHFGFSGTHRVGKYWLDVGDQIIVLDYFWQPVLKIWPILSIIVLLSPLTLWFVEKVRMKRAMNWNRFNLSRKGICWKCGYDLRGTREHRCPECGSINGRGDLIWSGSSGIMETTDATQMQS
ncbi:hypothetical protein IPV69_15600 [Humisphaera borealis]|uniref:Uncharacterized protein n=2 Tax=Humisphaera borealis TaxID=2807512 RepID=A0A7M2WQD8_9BACT|nr:hypothetical protein IPV69_15600 [Humisphaera borealis]